MKVFARNAFRLAGLSAANAPTVAYCVAFVAVVHVLSLAGGITILARLCLSSDRAVDEVRWWEMAASLAASYAVTGLAACPRAHGCVGCACALCAIATAALLLQYVTTLDGLEPRRAVLVVAS